MTTEHSPTAANADTARLIDLVATVQRTQRAEDVDGFLALFAQGAVWVNGAGRRLVGLEEIAITSIDQEYLTVDERALSPRRQGKPTYIWARIDGDWRIVQRQNTIVVQPDEAVPASITPQDSAAITAIVANVEKGFNENDPDLLTRDIASDARIVNAVGVELIGLDQIEASARHGLTQTSLSDATAHYRVHGVELLAPDIAVAQKRAWSTPEAAERGDSPEMVALYVFARRDGRWWVIRRQNTLVVGP